MQSDSQYISTKCGAAGNLGAFNNANKLWTIVGEWTSAMTSCASTSTDVESARATTRPLTHSTYLGSESTRVGGGCVGLTGSGSTFSPDYKAFLRQTFARAFVTR
jgi:glucan 1,3-beta-glucosidase